MNTVAISIKNLFKKYHLYGKPTDRLKEALHPFRKQYHRDFYALSDINLEINKGETIGIVGKNGAGKSTLLKIITGVLTHTSGELTVRGKIASLLELGTGFNPEMTGIENIYLNGSIMGYNKSEVDAKVDNIVEFADIGDFIHQPVKMYSSGMFARLAFSVAINVDPEILIVDEALSVGDLRFQQKCIRRMEQFGKQGKTVLFVTHDISTVNRFCNRAVWLHEGRIQDIGKTEDITKKYFSFMAYDLETNAGETTVETEEIELQEKHKEMEWTDVSVCDSFGEGPSAITHVALYDRESGKKLSVLQGGEKAVFYVKLDIKEEVFSPGIGLVMKNSKAENVFGIGNYIYRVDFDPFEPGLKVLKIEFTFPAVRNDDYSFTVALSDGTQMNHRQIHWVHDSLAVKVQNSGEPYFLGNLLVIPAEDIQFDVEKA